MEELKPTPSYNEWQKISIQKEVKLLCQKFGYEFSQSKLDELLEIYKDEMEGVYEFCCLYNYSLDAKYKANDGWMVLVSLLLDAKEEQFPPCKLGSDVILYLYTQISEEYSWNHKLVYCYNKAIKYTLPF